MTVSESAGKILVHCKGGCTQSEIINALKSRGLWDMEGHTEPTPIRRETRNAAHNETLVAIYQYKDETGAVVAEKGRFETPDPDGGKPSKRFAWRKVGVRDWPAGESGIRMNELPLFGAELVAESAPSEPVFYVEGERAAIACRENGLLAVSFAGGATSSDFGDALSVLAGRDVLLWPDNDVVGRKYMVRVHSRLRPVARSVRIVQPGSANEHDDAVEYFAGGGTARQILDGVPSSSPSVRWVDDDAITITQPSPVGTITFAFSEIEHSSKVIEAELDVSLSGPGLDGVAVSQRINVMSGSAVTDLRRLLDGNFGQEKNFWLMPLNRAVAALRMALATHDQSVKFGDIETPGQMRYLIDGIIPADEPVLIFGKGSAAKGWLAIRMALGIAVTGDFLGRNCQRAAVLYVDYEDNKQTFKRRGYRVAEGLGIAHEDIDTAPLYYWNAKGTPLASLVQGLKQKIARDNIEVVFIDSVVAACGGKPEEAETAMRYFNALSKLGIASISIAHIAKNGDGNDPFGSIFFTNFPRRTMLVTRSGEGTEFTLGITPKKVNDAGMMASFGMALTFTDPNGPIYTRYATVENEPDLVEKLGIREQLIAVLKGGARQLPELVEETGKTEQVIKNALYASKGTFENLNPGKGNLALWCLRVQPQREYSA